MIAKVDSGGVDNGSSQNLGDKVMVKGADGGTLVGYAAVRAVAKGDADTIGMGLQLWGKLLRFQDQPQQTHGVVLWSLPEPRTVLCHHEARNVGQQGLGGSYSVSGGTALRAVKALKYALQQEMVALWHQFMPLFSEGEGVFRSALLPSHCLERNESIPLEDVQVATNRRSSQTKLGAQLVYRSWLTLQQRQNSESCSFHINHPFGINT
jgi:hypothetical protein